MSTVKQTRTNHLEQSHVIVLNSVASTPQTLSQIVSSLGLNPSKADDVNYVSHRISILIDEGLCVALKDAKGRPTGSYQLTS